MASIGSLTVRYRYVLVTDAIAIVELIWPRGDTTLIGFLLDELPGEEWKRQADGGAS